MNWKQKAGIIFGALVVVGLLAYIVKLHFDLNASNQNIEKSLVELRQLKDDIVRHQSQYATKDDIELYAIQNGIDLNTIKDDLKRLGADVKSVSVVSVKTGGYTGINLPSTSSTPNAEQLKDESQDKFGYLKNKQNLKLEEPFGDKKVPFGEVGFSAWQEKPWSLKIEPREYKVSTVVSSDEDGRQFAHSRLEITAANETHSVTVTDAKMLQVYPEGKFSFNPKLFLGVDGGVLVEPPLRGEVVPSAQLFLFSHGKTKVNPTWSFLGVGPGYAVKAGNVAGIVTPVQYNLGDNLPLINNLHVGPGVFVDTAANLGVTVGVKAGL